jgi:hypothetical protein
MRKLSPLTRAATDATTGQSRGGEGRGGERSTCQAQTSLTKTTPHIGCSITRSSSSLKTLDDRQMEDSNHGEHEDGMRRSFQSGIGCAIAIYRHLGPCLLKSAYEPCPAHELSRIRIAFSLQLAQPVLYQDVRLDGDSELASWSRISSWSC